MARVRTLQSLIDDVRARADMDGDGHVTDAMITTWLNQGIAELWDELVYADPDSYYETDTFSTVANTESYTLPDDFYQVRGVDVVMNGRRFPLEPLTFQERIGPATTLSGYEGEPFMRYSIRRRSIDGSTSSIFFDPPPTGVYSILLHYVQAPQLLADPSDVLDGVAGWEDYPVVYAVIAALDRQEQSSTFARADLERISARIKRMAGLRDSGEPPQIADVRGRGRGRRLRW